MGIQIDIFGSCVCRDIIRYASKDDYEVVRCISGVPITTLYEPIIKFREEKLRTLPIGTYEKKMLKMQFARSAVKLLKKSPARILFIDLAEEALNRCRLSKTSKVEVAVSEKDENAICKFLGAKKKDGGNDLIYPETLDLKWAEEKYKRFAREIVQTEENPDGYSEKNIIVAESYFTEKIVSNQDGVLYVHDKKYRVHQVNEWLRELYGIFYKYIPECQVIRLPIFTHTTENHVRGVHPLSYTEDTYRYMRDVLDVLCGKSKKNSVDNLYTAQCLHNKLYTRVLKSTAIYSVDAMKKEIKILQQQVKELQGKLTAADGDVKKAKE